jgi:ElaB/YqjD/DUF883 family membrane-anchored ribosome-binding protein
LTHQPEEHPVRNSATNSGKDLAKEIARLQAQLEELSDSAKGAGNTLLEDTLRPARKLISNYRDTARSVGELRDKTRSTLLEHVEERPFTTLAALIGIGFLAARFFRRS